MSSVVEIVRDKTDSNCHVTTCKEGKCSLLLDGVSEPNVLISLEHTSAPVAVGEPRSDYLFVGSDENGGLWVAPIELTESKADFSKFEPQLRAGAAIADKLLPKNIPGVKFRPIAVHDGIHRDEVNKFRNSRNKISFRGNSVSIKQTRCGSPLTNALKG